MALALTPAVDCRPQLARTGFQGRHAMRTLWLLALQLALLVYSVSAQQVAARQISAVQQIHIAVGRNPGDVVITFLTVGSTVGSLPSVQLCVVCTIPCSSSSGHICCRWHPFWKLAIRDRLCKGVLVEQLERRRLCGRSDRAPARHVHVSVHS